MQALPVQDCVNAIGQTLHGKPNGKGGYDLCDCPVHGGHECLSVDLGNQPGTVTLYCHSCGPDGTPAIIEAIKQMGLPWPGPSASPSFAPRKGKRHKQEGYHIETPEEVEADALQQAAARKHAAAAEEAARLLKQASKNCLEHSYAKKKGAVFGPDARRGAFPGIRDALLIPFRNFPLGEVRTVQAIAPNGEKRFLAGGEKKGNYYAPGPFSQDTRRLYIAEGVATAGAVWKATGEPCIAAADAGNLSAVAQKMSKLCKWAEIILLADEDPAGIDAAQKAARVCGGKVARPQAALNTDAPPHFDFWDLWHEYGETFVRQALDKALPPPPESAKKKEASPLPASFAPPNEAPSPSLDGADAPLQAPSNEAPPPWLADMTEEDFFSEPPESAEMPLKAPETAQNAQTLEDEGGALDRELERLAGLSVAEYERQRKQAAKALGFRPTILDKVVEGMRAQAEGGQDLPIEETPPWPEPVNPAALLDEIEATIGRFIVCAPEVRAAATLWAAFTWFIDAVDVAPIALITAPEKQCGKTQMLAILGHLSYRALPTSGISPAALFRTVEEGHPTLMIDEADAFMKENEELRGIINSGHTRDTAYVIRTVGEDHTPKRFGTWGAKAIAGIKAEKLAPTITDRSIVLSMRRRLKTEQVERLRRAEPGLFPSLRQKLARFAQDASEIVRERAAKLEDLEALGDRQLDNWEPLRAIAEVAGSHWPQKVKEAALALSGVADEPSGAGPELLANVWEVFQERGNQDRISTADLLSALNTEEEWRWSTYNHGQGITARQIANILKGYGIETDRKIRIGEKSVRGYMRAGFEDAVSRYLGIESDPKTPQKKSTRPDLPFSSGTTEQVNEINELDQKKSGTQKSAVPLENPSNPLNLLDCSVVPLRTPPFGVDTLFEGNSPPIFVGKRHHIEVDEFGMGELNFDDEDGADEP